MKEDLLLPMVTTTEKLFRRVRVVCKEIELKGKLVRLSKMKRSGSFMILGMRMHLLLIIQI